MTSHEARANDTARYFGLDEQPGTPSAVLMAADAAAERALAHIHEVSPDMRGGAIISSDGSVLAASREPDRWAAAAKRLLDAAEGVGSGGVEHVHVATEEGEVFAVRESGLTAVAVTERFALASLMTFDMRASLRGLGAGAVAS